jgi:hypothetical protein
MSTTRSRSENPEQLLGDARSTDAIGALEHYYAEPLLGQIARTDEAVVSGPHDRDVVAVAHRLELLRHRGNLRNLEFWGKAGYLEAMARSAFCTTCSRTVYIEIDDSLVCPVCSSPILEAIDDEDEPELQPQPPQSPERK